MSKDKRKEAQGQRGVEMGVARPAFDPRSAIEAFASNAQRIKEADGKPRPEPPKDGPEFDGMPLPGVPGPAAAPVWSNEQGQASKNGTGEPDGHLVAIGSSDFIVDGKPIEVAPINYSGATEESTGTGCSRPIDLPKALSQLTRAKIHERLLPALQNVITLLCSNPSPQDIGDARATLQLLADVTAYGCGAHENEGRQRTEDLRAAIEALA